MKWSKYIASLPPDSNLSFFEEIADEVESQKQAAPPAIKLPEFLVALAKATESDRRDVFIDGIRNEVARIFGVDDPNEIDAQKGLMEMGMDSLVAVEFKNKLKAMLGPYGKSIPATLILSHPTIASISDYLLKSLTAKDFAFLTDSVSGKSPKSAEPTPVAAGVPNASPSIKLTEFLVTLAKATESDRRDVFVSGIRKEVARIFGVEDPNEIDAQKGLMEMGMDSLVAVEFKNKLKAMLGPFGKSIPATLILSHPTIANIADYLLNSLTAKDFAFLMDSVSGRNPKSAEPTSVIAVAPLDSVAPNLLPTTPNAGNEPIAIVGMSCRMPGGVTNPSEFWELLINGRDGVTEIPHERWDPAQTFNADPSVPGTSYVRHGGFLNGVDQFDPQFFGISPAEATALDPQQRLLLEASWEAMENACEPASELAGTKTGVFIGASFVDYVELINKSSDRAELEAYLVTGNSLSAISGRLAYVFGFQGPTLSLDTMCSSSLVAIHLACQSLRDGSCERALAGGINLMLTPNTHIVASRMRAVSPDGRCKTFDASANGFVRSEGCGVVILKRLSDAQKNGDRIVAIIRGTAVNQDGASTSFTAPNGQAQETLIRDALKNANVSPSSVGYIEAHGTGTVLGDPLEVQTITKVLSQDRKNSLIIGAVKSNIGHAEAASGVAGVIKVAMALQNHQVPGNIHLRKINPEIVLENIPAIIPTAPIPFPAINGRRIAGVSSFGITGTNAHLVLEEAPPLQTSPSEEKSPHSPSLLALSAKSAPALLDLAKSYFKHLENSTDSIRDICYSANIGRSHFDQRLAIVADQIEGIRTQLGEFISGNSTSKAIKGHKPEGITSRKIAFLFTGQGSQYVGMGKDLYESQPTFRKALDQCAEILGRHFDQPLLNIMFGTGSDKSLLNRTEYTQPALFALEYSLAQLWISWGVKPTAVMGHSVGEYVAACIAGVMNLEDALSLISLRAKLMQKLPSGGAMAAILTSESSVHQAIASYADRVSIAAVNGPENTVISGEATAIQEILARFEEKGIKTVSLNVSHAFHSMLMEPMLSEFEMAVDRHKFSRPRIRMISNLTGKVVEENEMGRGRYWRDHVRNAVRFADGVRTLVDGGCDVFLEIGPGTTLLNMAKATAGKKELGWFSSLGKGPNPGRQILENLGGLYACGVGIDWRGFEQNASKRKKVALPNYPFQRKRYWVDSRAERRTDLTGVAESKRPAPGTLVTQQSAPTTQNQIVLDLNQIPHEQQRQKTEMILRDLISKSLRLDTSTKFTPQTDFVDLGMDSLMAIVLRGQIQKVLKTAVELPKNLLFESRSLANLADAILLHFRSNGVKKETVGSALHNPWAVQLSRNAPSSQVTRLICLHYAGGSANIFKVWESSRDLDVWGVQLPGRWDRIHETSITDIKKIAAEAFLNLKPLLDRPFAFFGYSMGALVAYEILRLMREAGAPAPTRFFVAATHAPQHFPIDLGLHRLDDLQLIEKMHQIFKFNFPSDITSNAEVRETLIPIIRADYKALETYNPEQDSPFSFPIHVFGGSQDKFVTRAILEGWSIYTSSKFSVDMFEGGHFILDTAGDEVLKAVVQLLQNQDEKLPKAS